MSSGSSSNRKTLREKRFKETRTKQRDEKGDFGGKERWLVTRSDVCVSVCEEESKRVRSYSTTSLNLNLLHNSHSFIFARKYFLKRRCLCVSFKTISAAEKAPDDG